MMTWNGSDDFGSWQFLVVLRHRHAGREFDIVGNIVRFALCAHFFQLYFVHIICEYYGADIATGEKWYFFEQVSIQHKFIHIHDMQHSLIITLNNTSVHLTTYRPQLEPFDFIYQAREIAFNFCSQLIDFGLKIG